MNFEWDAAKNRSNIRKHGFDLADAAEMFQGALLVRPDTREEYGESRWIGIGMIRHRIAVLPVGYADGLNRALSSRGRVIIREHYAPIVGRISMDLTLVDVTGLPDVSVGDEVILLGSMDGLSVDAREHAALASTVLYEILCGISKRVPRRYSN